MRRLVLLLVFCTFAVSAFAQTKKILLQSDEAALLKELQSASPKATIVPVTARYGAVTGTGKPTTSKTARAPSGEASVTVAVLGAPIRSHANVNPDGSGAAASSGVPREPGP